MKKILASILSLILICQSGFAVFALSERPEYSDDYGTSYYVSADELFPETQITSGSEKLVDGKNSTYVDATAGTSIVLNFSKDTIVTSLVLIEQGSRINEYKIEASANGGDYFSVTSGAFSEDSNIGAEMPYGHTVSFEPVVAKYIKITVLSTHSDGAKLLEAEAYNRGTGKEINYANAEVRKDMVAVTGARRQTVLNAFSPNLDADFGLLQVTSTSIPNQNTFFAFDMGSVSEIDTIQVVMKRDDIKKYRVLYTNDASIWSEINALKGTQNDIDDSLAESMQLAAGGEFTSVGDDITYNETYNSRNLVRKITFPKTKCRYIAFVIDELIHQQWGGNNVWAVETYSSEAYTNIYTPDGNESEYNAAYENVALNKDVKSAVSYADGSSIGSSLAVITDGEKFDGEGMFYLGGSSPEITIDLGETMPVDHLVFYEYGQRITEYEIEASDDGVSFRKIGGGTKNEDNVREPDYTLAELEFTTAKFIKLKATELSGTAMLSEIEIYCRKPSATLMSVLTGADISDEELTAITTNIKSLPTEISSGNYTATVSWESSDVSVLDPETGRVKRSRKDKYVTLTATITASDSNIYEKVFDIVVLADETLGNTGSFTERPVYSDDYGNSYYLSADELFPSTQENGTAGNLVDGKNATYVDITTGEPIVLNFDKDTIMTSLVLTEQGSLINEYQIEASADGENYFPVKAGSFAMDSDISADMPLNHTISFEPVVAKYVKITVLSVHSDGAKLLNVEAYNRGTGKEINYANAEVRKDMAGSTGMRNDNNVLNALSPNVESGFTLLMVNSNSIPNQNSFFAFDMGVVNEIDTIQVVAKQDDIGKYRILATNDAGVWTQIKALHASQNDIDDSLAESMELLDEGEFSPVGEDADYNSAYNSRNLVRTFTFPKTKCRYIVFVLDKYMYKQYDVAYIWSAEAYCREDFADIYTPDGTESGYDTTYENIALYKEATSSAPYADDSSLGSSPNVLTDEEKFDGEGMFYLGGSSPEVTICLEETLPVDHIVFYEYGQRITRYEVEVSLDGKNFDKVCDGENTAASGRSPAYTVAEFDITAAKYIRLRATELSGTAMLSEIEVYCSKPSADLMTKITESDISDEDLLNLTADIKELPRNISNGSFTATVLWESSDESVINTETGVVSRGDEDTEVTLTATITASDSNIYTRVFTIVVLADKFTNTKNVSQLEDVNVEVSGVYMGENEVYSVSENNSVQQVLKQSNGFKLIDKFAVEFELFQSASKTTVDLDCTKLCIDNSDSSDLKILLGNKLVYTGDTPEENVKYRIEVYDKQLLLYADDNAEGNLLLLINSNMPSSAAFNSIMTTANAGGSAEVGLVSFEIPENALVEMVSSQFDFADISNDKIENVENGLTLISGVFGCDITYRSSDVKILNDSTGEVGEISGMCKLFVDISYNGAESITKTFDLAVKNMAYEKLVRASSVSTSNTQSSNLTNNSEGGYLTRADKYDIVIDLGQNERITDIVIDENSEALGSIKNFKVYIGTDEDNLKEVFAGNSISERTVISFNPKETRYIKVSVLERTGKTSGFDKIRAFFSLENDEKTVADISDAKDLIPDRISSSFTLPLVGLYGSELSYSSSSQNLSITKTNDCYNIVFTTPNYDEATTILVSAKNNYGEISETIEVYLCGKNQLMDSLPSDENNLGGGSGGGGGGGISSDKLQKPEETNKPEETTPENETIGEFDKELNGHWGKTEIETLIEKGIIKGNGNSLNLKNNVTRAEFIAMIVRALELETISYKNSFADVKPENWYADIIQTAFEYGVFSGSNIGAEPEKAISRQEAAVMLSNLFEGINNEDVAFTDGSDVSGWAEKGVKTATELGLIKGYEDNTIRPLNNIKRDEAMVVIYRLLQLEISK